MDNKERLKSIDEALEEEKKKYAEEIARITKQRGFDSEKPKWQKKINAAADEFAKRFVELWSIREEITAGKVDPELEDPRKWFVGKK